MKNLKKSTGFSAFWKTVRGKADKFIFTDPPSAVLMSIKDLEDWSFTVWRESRIEFMDKFAYNPKRSKILGTGATKKKFSEG